MEELISINKREKVKYKMSEIASIVCLSIALAVTVTGLVLSIDSVSRVPRLEELQEVAEKLYSEVNIQAKSIQRKKFSSHQRKYVSPWLDYSQFEESGDVYYDQFTEGMLGDRPTGHGHLIVQSETGNKRIKSSVIKVKENEHNIELTSRNLLRLHINDLVIKNEQVIPIIAPTRGPNGETGECGTPGLHGDIGDKGSPGPIGSKGEQGDRGMDGITGIDGDVGDAGIPADKGVPGNVGRQGGRGDMYNFVKIWGTEEERIADENKTPRPSDFPSPGETGYVITTHIVYVSDEKQDLTGIDNITTQYIHGLKGQKGEKGAPTGPKGSKGNQGEMGVTIAESGDVGDKGFTCGEHGDAGINSTTKGTDGLKGAVGDPGPTGSRGNDGDYDYTGILDILEPRIGFPGYLTGSLLDESLDGISYDLMTNNFTVFVVSPVYLHDVICYVVGFDQVPSIPPTPAQIQEDGIRFDVSVDSDGIGNRLFSADHQKKVFYFTWINNDFQPAGIRGPFGTRKSSVTIDLQEESKERISEQRPISFFLYFSGSTSPAAVLKNIRVPGRYSFDIAVSESQAYEVKTNKSSESLVRIINPTGQVSNVGSTVHVLLISKPIATIKDVMPEVYSDDGGIMIRSGRKGVFDVYQYPSEVLNGPSPSVEVMRSKGSHIVIPTNSLRTYMYTDLFGQESDESQSNREIWFGYEHDGIYTIVPRYLPSKMSTSRIPTLITASIGTLYNVDLTIDFGSRPNKLYYWEYVTSDSKTRTFEEIVTNGSLQMVSNPNPGDMNSRKIISRHYTDRYVHIAWDTGLKSSIISSFVTNFHIQVLIEHNKNDNTLKISTGVDSVLVNLYFSDDPEENPSYETVKSKAQYYKNVNLSQRESKNFMIFGNTFVAYYDNIDYVVKGPFTASNLIDSKIVMVMPSLYSSNTFEYVECQKDTQPYTGYQDTKFVDGIVTPYYVIDQSPSVTTKSWTYVDVKTGDLSSISYQISTDIETSGLVDTVSQFQVPVSYDLKTTGWVSQDIHVSDDDIPILNVRNWLDLPSNREEEGLDYIDLSNSTKIRYGSFI